jgi:pyruvate dehydrogenase E2 component (dihydrolipoamide acetyltransferase)
MTRTAVVMPKLNYDMTSGTIASWAKGAGDQVRRGDVLFEVEMDKGIIEVEALTTGVLAEIVETAGHEVAVGQPVAFIEES